MSNNIRTGYELAAKAIAERGKAWSGRGDYALAMECSQLVSMLHDLKPVAAPSVASGAGGELPPLPEPLEIDWPELHSQALGCGVEDRNIHDRYEAAEYGWQDGVGKAIERVPDSIYDADQMQAYARAAIERAILANSAPNKALVESLQQVMRPYGIYDVAVSKAGGLQDDFMEVGKQIRAALNAAGVELK